VANLAPLNIKSILDAVEEFRQAGKIIELPDVSIGIDIRGHMIYRAVSPWNQSVYVARYFRYFDFRECSTWAKEMLENFSTFPKISFARNGNSKDINSRTYNQSMKSIVKKKIWERKDIASYKPREISLSPFSKGIVSRYKDIILVKSKEEKKMKTDNQLIKKGKLTNTGIQKVRKLAAEGKDTNEIAKAIGDTKILTIRKSITAYVARSRRKSHKPTRPTGTTEFELTPKEIVAYDVVLACLSDAKKTSNGKRIRGLAKKCMDAMEKRKLKKMEITSASNIHHMIKRLAICGALQEIARNKRKGEKIKSILYGVNEAVLGSIKVKPKIKETKKQTKSTLQGEQTAISKISQNQSVRGIIANIQSKQKELRQKIAEDKIELDRLESAVKVLIENSGDKV